MMWKLPFHALFNFDTTESTNGNRDDLSKNGSCPCPKKVKKGDYCLAAKTEEEEEEEEEEEAAKNSAKRSSLYAYGNGSSRVEQRGVIRVKVKMTKQEAARLISKCKDGGVLEFKDVAHELVQIPMNRVSVVSSCVDGDGVVLKTIPEET